MILCTKSTNVIHPNAVSGLIASHILATNYSTHLTSSSTMYSQQFFWMWSSSLEGRNYVFCQFIGKFKSSQRPYLTSRQMNGCSSITTWDTCTRASLLRTMTISRAMWRRWFGWNIFMTMVRECDDILAKKPWIPFPRDARGCSE